MDEVEKFSAIGHISSNNANRPWGGHSFTIFAGHGAHSIGHALTEARSHGENARHPIAVKDAFSLCLRGSVRDKFWDAWGQLPRANRRKRQER